MAQFYTFADSIGSSGAQLANFYQNRDLADQRLLAQQIQMGRDRQAQANWEAQMRERSVLAAQGLAQRSDELDQRRMERAGDLSYRNRTLNLEDRRLKLYENAPSPEVARKSIEADKAAAQAQQYGLEALVAGINADGSLDENNEAFLKAHPLVRQTLLSEATRKRAELKPKLDRKVAALKIANQAARIEQVAAGIGDTKMERDRGLEDRGWSPFSFGRNNAPADPQVIATDLRAKALKMRTDSAQLLKEAGLDQNPDTQHFTTQLPDWYKQSLGRQLNMSTPQATAPAPRPVNIAAPPTATGTNRPPMVLQNGTAFKLMPDGSYQPVTP